MKSSSPGARQLASSERLMRRDDWCDVSTTLNLGLEDEQRSLRTNEALDGGSDCDLELPADVLEACDQARAELEALGTLDCVHAYECCIRTAGWFVRDFAPSFLRCCGEDEFASALSRHSRVDELSSLDRAAALCSSMTYLVDGALERAFHFAFGAIDMLSGMKDGEADAIAGMTVYSGLMLDAIGAALGAVDTAISAEAAAAVDCEEAVGHSASSAVAP